MLPSHQVLGSILSTCPVVECHIRTFSLSVERTIQGSLSDTLACCAHRLRYLNVDLPLTTPDLIFLGTLPHLTRLEISMTQSNIVPKDPIRGAHHFMNLESLTLDIFDITTCTLLLTRVFHSCRLSQLKVLAAPRRRSSDAQRTEFLRSIGQITSLEDLRFGLARGGSVELWVVDFDHLEPLYTLHNLHTFHIYPWAGGPSPPSLIKYRSFLWQQLHAMSEAWPRLRSLRLMTVDPDYPVIETTIPAPSISPSILPVLLYHFRALTDLTLTLNPFMSEEELLETKLTMADSPPHPLRFLGLPCQHSRFLSPNSWTTVKNTWQLCPRLEFIAGKGWEAVWAHYQELARSCSR